MPLLLRLPFAPLPQLRRPSTRTLLLTGAAVVTLGAGLAAWTVLASTVLVWGTGVRPLHGSPTWEWWTYALDAPRWHPAWPKVQKWLSISGVGAAVPMLFTLAGMARFAWRRRAVLRPVRRGRSDNLGHADWMSMEEARDRYGGPDPVAGGIIVGEAYRVDQDSVARMRFDPKNPRTWGQGGAAPLLIDAGADGPLSSMVLAGAGGFKTSTLVTTLVHPLGWRSSVVVMDPSCEIGPMVRLARLALGHKVMELVPGGDHGFDALGWIDTDVPEAEANVAAAVGWVVGTSSKDGRGEEGKWKAWGRDLVTALCAHMLWMDEHELPRRFRTLRTLRTMVVTPADEMRVLLGVIHRTSNSQLARDLAGTLKDLVDETFSGIYQNATGDTAWLSNEAFVGLVSGDAFRTSELVGGKLTVLLQVPQKTLETTPAIARVVIGALLNAVFEADGAVVGKVLFELDEAVLLRDLPPLKIALTQGRKYKIVLRPYYQDDGQVEEVWGKAGKRTWFSNLAWRAYAGVSDLDVAKEVSGHCGEFAVMAASEGRNKGISLKLGEMGSSSSGATTNEHEIKRELIKPAEILHDMRADEMIVLPRGGSPLRCGRAIYFRRKDLEGRVGANRFTPASVQPGTGAKP